MILTTCDLSKYLFVPLPGMINLTVADICAHENNHVI